MTEQISIISVEENAERELSAASAKLHITITGQSYFSGNEAFKKALELKTLKEGLLALGYGDDQIHIRDVQLRGTSGFLSKSSAATYALELSCEDLDLLGPTLAEVASLKNADLGHIEWGYGDLDAIKRELVVEAAANAHALAENVAAASSMSVKGLHRFRYGNPVAKPEDLGAAGGGFEVAVLRSAQPSAAAPGMDVLSLTNTMKVRVEIFAEYSVLPLN